jgi:FAD synthase
MDLEFHRWIRGEKKFTDASALANQIRVDVQSVLEKGPDRAHPKA